MLAERKPLMERIAVRPNWVGVLDFQTSIGGDVRAGGAYSSTMVRDETGESFPVSGRYLEVVS